jgi:hypothetical protein
MVTSNIIQELTNQLRYDVLKSGHENAISKAELTRYFGFKDDRLIRSAIRELQRQRVIPVISALSDPSGYFIPVSRQEAKPYLETEHGRAISIFDTCKDVEYAINLTLPPEQGRLIF